MAEPLREDLRARRNTPFVHVFEVTGDLTGHTAGLQVRLYGMQPGDPLLDLGMVTDDQTQGLMIDGTEVRAFADQLHLLFMPEGRPNRDVRFFYDLILTAPDGYSWVERWGAFDVADGVTDDDYTFLTTAAGAVLTTEDGTPIEVA